MIKSGSSSIKFGLFAIAPEPSALCRGTINAAAGATMVHQVRVHRRVLHAQPVHLARQLFLAEFVEQILAKQLVLKRTNLTSFDLVSANRVEPHRSSD
jgi:acetate kinase